LLNVTARHHSVALSACARFGNQEDAQIIALDDFSVLKDVVGYLGRAGRAGTAFLEYVLEPEAVNGLS
jgi:hypothetical protein